MSKTLRTEYKDALKEEVVQQVYCMRIVRTDGSVFRFISNVDKEIMMSNGNKYVPDAGGFNPTAVAHNADYKSVTIDLDGVLLPNGITREDLVSGRYDYADVYIFRTIAEDPVEDDEEVTSGKFGKISITDESFTIQFRSLADLLNQKIVRIHSSLCDDDFGGPRCQYPLKPNRWQASTAYSVRQDHEAESGDIIRPSSDNGYFFECITAGTSGGSEPSWNTTVGGTTVDGTVEWRTIHARHLEGQTVASVNSQQEFVVSALNQPDDWWGGTGKVLFTSGENNGVEKEVDTSANDGTITLWEPFPFAINVGDTFEIQAGCRKRQTDCKNKHNNKYNFQGFPDIPGRGNTTTFGGQK